MMHQECDPHGSNGSTEPFGPSLDRDDDARREMSGYPPQRGSGPLNPEFFPQQPNVPGCPPGCAGTPAGWTPRPKVTVGNWLTILTLVLGFVGMVYAFGSSQATTNSRLSTLENDVHQINAYQSTEHLVITVETAGVKAHTTRQVVQVPRSGNLKPSGSLNPDDFKGPNGGSLDTRGHSDFPPEPKR
jgi:hypothetical protein